MKIYVKEYINKTIRVLLSFLFLLVIAESLYAPIFAVFVTNYIEGATLATAGLAVAIFSIVKSIVQLPLARYLDKNRGERDDFWVLVVGALASTLFPFFLLVVSKPWQLYLAEVFAGIGTAALMAAYYAIFAHHVDKGSEAFEWSLFSVGGLTLSYAIGAATGGFLADLFGFPRVFLISGIINVSTTVLLFFLYPFINGFRKRVPPAKIVYTKR